MAYIWLGIVIFLACSITTEAGRKLNKAKKCEKITVPECANIGYQRTKFPNPFTNITSQEETNNLTRFLPVLAQIKCTKTNAMPFLCSVYVPICTEKKPVMPPCREFCEKAVGSCPALAASYGIQWPSPLVCSNYPTKGSGERCISKLKSRNKNENDKKEKKKPKADETKCCRFGVLAAIKNKTCSISDAIATTQRKRFLKGLAMCKNFETKFNECCKKQAAKIQARKAKKQDKKDKKKGRKEKQNKADKQQKKDERQQKRKQKKNERKQKKAGRKHKKQNRKQNKKDKKGGKSD